ncbi:MAG: hypothetical protein H0W18_11545 [Acidobacteria bacterium]|nr:hypothetical protein [Acidobacteriota bacterium]
MKEALIDQDQDSHVYVPFGRNYRSAMNMHVRTTSGDAAAMSAMLETLRRELRVVDSRLPILELTTFQQVHDRRGLCSRTAGAGPIFHAAKREPPPCLCEGAAVPQESISSSP